MAKILKSNGTEVAPSRELTFEECQKIVGGFVEVVYINSQLSLLVNEEGLPMSLPFNLRASELSGQHIVGDVVFLENAGEAKRILDG